MYNWLMRSSLRLRRVLSQLQLRLMTHGPPACRPGTLQDVQRAVLMHDHVRGVGGGWSWNQPFFCAPNATLLQGGSGGANGSSRGSRSSDVGSVALPPQQQQQDPRLVQKFDGPSDPGAADGLGLGLGGRQPSSVNVVMTTLRPLLIVVDEEEESVLVDAGGWVDGWRWSAPTTAGLGPYTCLSNT